MKFLSEIEFYETVNKWVRDGSNITSADSYSSGVVFNLLGTDGCTESLVLYFNEEDYRRSEMVAGDQKVGA